MVRYLSIIAAALSLAACQTAAAPSASEAPSQQADTPSIAELELPQFANWVEPDYPDTRILDVERANMLVGNSGITLQWISWDWRGLVYARWQDETIVITAEQNADKARGGVTDLAPGSVYMSGYVEEIGPFHFIFNGYILIQDAPDKGRYCKREGAMEFRITQNRKYWRLQDMLGCDGQLTDYVDIYF